MQPISTNFAGVEHRSRNEARWAAFLRYLNIPHIYEVEGWHAFVAGKAEPYLPDFLLPRLNLWLEIKSDKIEERIVNICHAFNRNNKRIVVVFGIPRCDRRYKHGYIIYDYGEDLSRPQRFLFAICRRCGSLAIVPADWLDGKPDGAPLASVCTCISRDTANFLDSRLLKAHLFAMRCKFGERGTSDDE